MWRCVCNSYLSAVLLCVYHTRVIFPGKRRLLSTKGSLRLLTFHAVNSQACSLSFFLSPLISLCVFSSLPFPSFHSSHLLSLLWRSAPTTLFLIWKVSPFLAGHSSRSDQSSGLLVWSFSQSCVPHVLLRTAPLRLWRFMWNYLLFLLSLVISVFFCTNVCCLCFSLVFMCW